MASCDEHGLLDLDTAIARLAAAIPGPAWEGMKADRDDPALDIAAMDGAAMRSADGPSPRAVLGTLFAGDDPAAFQVGAGEAVRIMTGAALPQGADCVVPIELLREVVNGLVPSETPQAGANIRRRGSHAKAGDELLPEGLPLTAARVGLRAWTGLPVPPPKRIRVGIASTGDELNGDPAPWQIRDSNGPMLAALTHNLGAWALRLPPLPDVKGALSERLSDLTGLSVLITSGGVSMGEKDLMPVALRELGADILFHKLNLKPGKPMLAAILGRTVVLGLPGNPQGAYLNARIFLPIVLARLQGTELPELWRRGQLAEAVANKGDRPLLQPCRREDDRLTPLPSRSSGDLVTLARADACAWIPAGGAAPGPVRYLDLL
ncbi:MAG TPA: molybdopterin molybdotransferase MoeA [Holophagaceae bacterium]|nr:molybdopterin molybdotransferase MoeA [Holophagaceae bacterium]